MAKIMGLVGSWGWYGGESRSGIRVSEYNDGKFVEKEQYYPEAIIGSPVVKTKKGMLYFISEVKNTDELSNEGGYAYSARLVKDKIIPINRIKTYSPNPCYCLLDTEERFLFVVHHSSGRDAVTKIFRDENNKVSGRVDYNDAAVEIIEILEDGALGEIVDFDFHDSPFPGKRSFLHGVFRIENSNIFIVVDKGLNSLYSYTIDYRQKRLVLMDKLEISYNCAPKYLCFVPGMDILYCGYELDASFAIVKYNRHTGELEHIRDCPVQAEDLHVLGIQDLMVSPLNSDILYVNFYEYGINSADLPDPKTLNNSWSQWSFDGGKTPVYVGVYDIKDKLDPKLIQKVRVADSCARRFGVTPDNKYLLTFNTEDNSISRLEIQKDGMLHYLDQQEWYHPENVTYFEI